jgi:hypothetical protein
MFIAAGVLCSATTLLAIGCSLMFDLSPEGNLSSRFPTANTSNTLRDKFSFKENLVATNTNQTKVIWSDNFSSGDFSNWSWVQGQNPGEGPGPTHVFVAPTNSLGLPAAPGGSTNVAQFELPVAHQDIMA